LEGEIDDLYFFNQEILTGSVMVADQVIRGNQGLKLSRSGVRTDCRTSLNYIQYSGIYVDRNNLKRNATEYLYIKNFFTCKFSYHSDPVPYIKHPHFVLITINIWSISLLIH
jgi:hypothetical protein